MFNSIFINNSRFRFFTYNSRFNKCFLDPIRFLLSPFNIPTTHAVGGRPWPLSRNNGRGRLPTVCVVGILRGDKKKGILFFKRHFRPWPFTRGNGGGHLPTACAVEILRDDKKKGILVFKLHFRPRPLLHDNGHGRPPTVCVVRILRDDKKKEI